MTDNEIKVVTQDFDWQKPAGALDQLTQKCQNFESTLGDEILFFWQQRKLFVCERIHTL